MGHRWRRGPAVLTPCNLAAPAQRVERAFHRHHPRRSLAGGRRIRADPGDRIRQASVARTKPRRHGTAAHPDAASRIDGHHEELLPPQRQGARGARLSHHARFFRSRGPPHDPKLGGWLPGKSRNVRLRQRRAGDRGRGQREREREAPREPAPQPTPAEPRYQGRTPAAGARGASSPSMKRSRARASATRVSRNVFDSST